MSLELKLERLIHQSIADMGLVLWGTQFFPQQRLLRVYIDNDSGITVNDCAMVSRQISPLLDAENLVSGHYTLEVSSPGLDRPLLNYDHWQASLGEILQIELFSLHQGRKRFRGVLLKLEDDKALLRERKSCEVIELSLSQVKRVNIVPQF